MKTVSTKKELEDALSSGERKVILKGEVAEKIIRSKKRKKGALIGGIALIVGGLVALPFTGGASATGILGGLGLTVGTVTISAAELTILAGGSITVYGIYKGYNVEFKPGPDGPVVILTGKE